MEHIEKQNKRLNGRFQFLLTITLFFPIVFGSLLEIANQAGLLDKTNLGFGVLVAFLIVDYIIIELINKWTYPLFFKAVNLLVFVNLGLYVVILGILGGFQNTEQLPGFLYPIFATALEGVMYIPETILFLLLINFLIWVAKVKFGRK